MAGVKSFYAKAVSFANRYVEIVKDLNTSKDYIYYGHDNLLPNKCIKYIKDSGTANKCINKISEYTEADGFVEERTQSFQFNPEQKGDAFLSDICMQIPIFQGFALHISRKQDGSIGESKVLPFQKIRKSKKGGYWYNQNLGTSKYKESEWVWYPDFKGVKVNPLLLKDLKQGEIFYAYKKTAENPFYPIPDYYSGIEDVITSAELQKLDLEMVINGFIPSAMLTFIGQPNQEVEGENGKTVSELYIDELKEFTGLTKNADGMAGRNSLFVTWAATREEAPVLQPFDAKAILDAANSKRDAINRDVCRLFGVHPVLIGFSEATILGNQQALSNAQKSLVDGVNSYQRFITDSLKKVYPDLDFTISQVSPMTVADPNLLDVLTVDEKRNFFFGLKPIQESVAKVENDFLNFYEIKAQISPDEMAQRYKDYYDTVNMTYSELERWSNTECSKLAGLSRAPITRNLELLNINKADWTDKHYRWAGQTIAFVNRMKENLGGENVVKDRNGKECGTKAFISLKNWAFDPDK